MKFQRGYTPWNKDRNTTTFTIQHNRKIIRFSNDNRQYYSRYLMEKKLGRKLKEGEQVHHIDGDTLNNSLDNLQVMDIRGHSSFHSKGRVLPKRRRITKTCLTCGKKFETFLSQKDRRKFCSLGCKYKYQIKLKDNKGRFKSWKRK